MSRSILDIHILQTVPPSNLNRDDTGSPKTAIYGGVRRARVSSQAWKRATRIAFNDTLCADELGVRTKQVVYLLSERIKSVAPELADQADSLATETLKAVGIKTTTPKSDSLGESGYLVFFSSRQLDNLAEAAISATKSDAKLPQALKAQDVKAMADSDHSIDVALFGRMVAEIKEINVDAAAQVAHAISVHPVENEYDYFTAVDDQKEKAEESGAGMIGTVEFNSATLYRYAALDVDRLQDNLGNAEATKRATEAFVRAFTTSMPSGKQNTFANHTLPDAIVVKLRESQPISLVGAFEEAITDGISSGRVQQAAERLVEYANDVEYAYDEPAIRTWVVRVGDCTTKLASLGEEVTIEQLVSAIGSEVANRVASST